MTMASYVAATSVAGSIAAMPLSDCNFYCVLLSLTAQDVVGCFHGCPLLCKEVNASTLQFHRSLTAMAASSESAFMEARLTKELATAVSAEETYSRVNEMKKRAITTAATYDDFKNLVACAKDGLKPVSNKELQDDLLHTSGSAFPGSAGHASAAAKAVALEASTRAGAGGRKRIGRKRKPVESDPATKPTEPVPAAHVVNPTAETEAVDAASTATKFDAAS